MPGSRAMCPTGHFVHCVAFASTLYVPGSQDRHSMLSVAYRVSPLGAQWWAARATGRTKSECPELTRSTRYALSIGHGEGITRGARCLVPLRIHMTGRTGSTQLW